MNACVHASCASIDTFRLHCFAPRRRRSRYRLAFRAIFPPVEPPGNVAMTKPETNQQVNLTTSPGNPVVTCRVNNKYAFVELRSSEECTKALNLNGIPFMGQVHIWGCFALCSGRYGL